MTEIAGDVFWQGGDPVRLVVRDDLRRSRLTIFFRGLLSVPHLIWLLLYGIPVVFVRLAAWVVGTFTGRIPDRMHDYMGRYVRYSTFVGAYRLYAANPFPPFGGREGSYPLDVVFPRPEKQNRLTIFFRGLLSFWAVIVGLFWGIWAGLVAFVAFWYALVLGRMHPGLQRRLCNYIRYSVETAAYQSYLTQRYPRVST